MDLPKISEKKNTLRKSKSLYLEFLALLNLHMRDVTAVQNFLKNASIYSLERSGLTPKSPKGIGDIFCSRILKYYHFFLINFMVNNQNISENKNNISI
jgi:hypothetical protein